MFVDGITEGNSVEALVSSVYERVRKVAARYHAQVRMVGFEDVVSVGMLAAVEAATQNLPLVKLPRSAKRAQAFKRSYLVRAAANRIINLYQAGDGDILGRSRLASKGIADYSDPLSLDMTLASGSSWYDILAFVDPVLPRDRNFAPLYDAIASLPGIYRQAICMRFGLCGYGMHRNCEIASVLQISCSAVGHRVTRGLAMLREHTELLSLIGVRDCEVAA
jgi:RNA polymerase sigma factor (sigma-70 family)